MVVDGLESAVDGTADILQGASAERHELGSRSWGLLTWARSWEEAVEAGIEVVHRDLFQEQDHQAWKILTCCYLYFQTLSCC